MVPVVKPGEGVRCTLIEPRVVRQDNAVFPVHGDEGVGLVGVVVHHVQNDGDASFMTRIHKGFQVVFGAIGLVHRKVEGGLYPQLSLPLNSLTGINSRAWTPRF